MEANKIGIKEFELKNEMLYKNTPVLKYSIKYPHFTSNAVQYFIEKLNRRYRNQAYSLTRYCEGKLYREAVRLYIDSIANGFPFYEYEFIWAYYIPYNRNYVLSLYFDQYQYKSGANGTTYRSSESWNINTCRKIELGELFPNEQHLKNFIATKVNEEIAIQKKEDPNGANYFDDYEKLVAQYFDPKNFYMTTCTVNVYFQEITIAPHSSGIPVFEIA